MSRALSDKLADLLKSRASELHIPVSKFYVHVDASDYGCRVFIDTEKGRSFEYVDKNLKTFGRDDQDRIDGCLSICCRAMLELDAAERLVESKELKKELHERASGSSETDRRTT